MKFMYKAKKYGFGAVLLAVGNSAVAAPVLDALDITAAVTDLTTDVTTMFDSVFPLAVISTAFIIGIGLFKKYTKKAAS